MTEYIVLCGQVIGGGPQLFEIVYSFDRERFSDRHAAIQHGLKERGSNDFNIGVVKDGELVSLDWMNEAGETDSALLKQIAEQVGIVDI